MKSSESLGKIGKALAVFQGALKPAPKDSENPFFKSKYADLTSLWESCREVLSKNELSIVQTFEDRDADQTLWIETTLIHSSGEWIASTLGLTKMKQDPQSLGSLITYGRRYALGAILGLVTDEDDDANAAMPKTGEKATASTRLQNTPKLPVRATQKQEAQTRERAKQEPVAEKSITEKLITGELTEDPDPPQENPPSTVSPFKKPEPTKSTHNDTDPIDETTWKFIRAQFPDNWAEESQSDFADWVRATLKENGLTPMKDLNKLTRAMGRTLLQVATYCGDRSVLEFVVPEGYVIPKPKSPVS